jgi:hypothetical protein
METILNGKKSASNRSSLGAIERLTQDGVRPQPACQYEADFANDGEA